MSTIKKSGRPSINNNKRGKLIIAAKKLFVIYDYDKVSIRAIATEAGVDSALIRYYFQSKLGLFTAMVQQTAEPVVAQFDKQLNALSPDSAHELMTTYYQVMSQNPDFPKLIFKIASMQENEHSQVLKKILSDVLNPKNVKLFSLMKQQGLLQDHVDPLCMQISFFSMMVFPFLMPEFFKQVLQLDITPEFMTHLALQNQQLLQHGCIKPATTETKDIS
ncbi:TetR family transcriptional regulator [Psychromonas marina]|uniref:TetR family transcriptional regulator n=1 Tax=Psychromonas marina TaxID=88364 RepID=A0ABQ6DWZ1_9GAMM|nr:TetR/AcrR family transcriptional regulator [Psychromonas marina]GLS89666.1 TetR family transcriptional regulator [Psychromonas marina]